MTFVVTENCIQCRNTLCVEVCPVDCFKETPLMLVIDPDECIDCTLCVPECPVEAIVSEEEVPASQQRFIGLNDKLSKVFPAISRSKGPLPNADAWKDIPGKAILLDSWLADPLQKEAVESRALYQHIVSAESLSTAEWENGLADPNPIVRLLLASRDDFALDRSRLIRGIADGNENVRGLYVVRSGQALTAADIDVLLDDPSQNVRLAVVQSRASDMTPTQTEHALRDPDSAVRLAVIKGPAFRPTEHQLFRSLENGSPEEVRAMLSRMHVALVPGAVKHASAIARAAAYGFGGIKLSAEQVKAGLLDPEPQVRIAVISRPDFVPTPKQFAAVVESGDPLTTREICEKATTECIDAAIAIPDPTLVARVLTEVAELTPAQIARCLDDRRSPVPLAVLGRRRFRLSKEQLAICIQSPDAEVRYRAVTLYGVENLSAKQWDACLRDSLEKLRRLVVASPSVRLSNEQVELALLDSGLQVRHAIATRADFLPTVGQFKRGANDKSKKVRETFLTRFKIVKGKIVDPTKPKNSSRSNPTKHLIAILDEIAKIETWTRRKHELKAELYLLIEELAYIRFSVSARSALFSRIGEHAVIDVPLNKRGALQPMRGKKAHVVCLGQGTYSSVHFGAKAV